MGNHNLDIAMFPWLAMGHIIPYINLANQLAARGHRISFLIPKKTMLKLQHHSLHPNLITFHPLIVLDVDGLPLGAETASDIPLFLNNLLAVALDLMAHQLQEILTTIKPQLVFYDFAYWIPDITKHLGIQSVCYHVVSTTSLAFGLVPSRYVPDQWPISEKEAKEPPPGFPSPSILLRGHEILSMSILSRPFGNGTIKFHDRLTRGMRNCDALAVRSCRELEGKFCDYIGTQYGKSLLLTGLALPELANKPTLEDRWAKWLKKFEIGSVVFCAFGSQYFIEKDQFQELVLGFELTGLPFFVALKPPIGCKTIVEALPDGFEERVKEIGVVHGEWIQQPLILSHPSIGCFVSHCGLGSMMEGLMSDNQIVFVPDLADQILNTKLLVEELKIAVEVKRELENGWFLKESLSKAIDSVMDKESEVGMMVKANHAKLKEVLEKPGLMDGYIDKFVEDLRELVKQRN